MLGQAQGAQDDALTYYVPFQGYGRELLMLLAVGLLVTYLMGIITGMLLYKAFLASRRVEPLPAPTAPPYEPPPMPQPAPEPPPAPEPAPPLEPAPEPAGPRRR
eukprot:15457444-Alexandrium_andersonii.AAC.1